MSLFGGNDKIKEKKFLVDLERHTYISEKSHQEIIDLAGLKPSGYDNYLKGWVKADGTIKVWVESLEDIVFRYWSQMKIAFRLLLKEDLTKNNAKTYAIVNRIERFAGVVKDFMHQKNKQQFYEDKIGYAIQHYGQPAMEKNTNVMLLVNYKINADRYILAGTKGKIVSKATGSSKKIRIKWKNSVSGYMKTRAGLEMLTDRRLISLTK